METETPKKPKRVWRSRDEINELLERFEESGQTQEAFCLDRSLSIATFSSWHHLHRK